MSSSSDISKLIAKYDVQVPRYTSYPTVPYWEEAPQHDQWVNHLRSTLQDSQSRWSMYMHLPFCESLCTFCGCNTSITKDHKKEQPYIDSILKELGFDRVSIGVQDFNPEVQRLVNRVQPYDITAKLTEQARALGFRSVNYDLIYGLAKQTAESFAETAKLTVALRPDRIALYSFALVPWIKPAQRLFKDEDLPAGAEKRRLYEIAREILMNAGYVEIGMDHFALPSEALSMD